MKKLFLLSFILSFSGISAIASGLPKQSVQALMKALQDSNLEVRTAAAQAFAELPDALATMGEGHVQGKLVVRID